METSPPLGKIKGFLFLFTSMVPKCMHGQNADVFPGVIARNKPCHEYGKFVHSTFYPYIIHPHSLFRVYWEISYVGFYLFQLLFFFLLWAFVHHHSAVYQLFLTMIFLVNLLDVILSFFTGYVESGTEIVVLDPARIAQRYILTTLILDIPSIVPLEQIAFIISEDCTVHHIAQNVHRCQNLTYLTVIAILMKIAKSILYLKNTSKVLFWNPLFYGLVCLLYIFLAINNLNLIFLIVVLNLKRGGLTPFWENIYQLVHFLENFFFAFYSNRVRLSAEYVLSRIPALILLSFFDAILTAYVIKYIRFRMRTTERFYHLESNVRTLARKRRLPIALKQKIFLYFKVFIQSKHYKEDDIFYYFPDAFKADIYSHFSLSLLKKFQPFEGLPKYILGQLAEALKYQLHLPNEMVMMKGEETISMYFIQSGRVALYSGENIEIYHFDDGDYFNANNFMEGKVSSNKYAISVEVTEIHRLDLVDFQRIMTAYPLLLERIRERFYREVAEIHPLME